MKNAQTKIVLNHLTEGNRDAALIADAVQLPLDFHKNHTVKKQATVVHWKA